MEKHVLVVPAGVRYISDWEKLENGYNLSDYPYPHIVNKKITGCGFTEYCIRNDKDTIICSPRKILLENKESQHDTSVFYFKNEITEDEVLFYDKDLIPARAKKNRNEIYREQQEELEMSEFLTRLENLASYHGGVVDFQEFSKDLSAQKKLMVIKMSTMKKKLLNYISQCREYNKPIKILVTYDSFRYIKSFVYPEVLQEFQIVIDEFQSIFVDARYKSTTEMDLLVNLKGLSKVCFVSATPMIEEYLEQLDEFKDLPFYEFDWKTEEPGRIIRPLLNVISTKRPISSAAGVINSYLNNEFEKFITDDGEIIYSTEAVLYFNSVKDICGLIKECKLTPENTNVLCSVTKENVNKVKKAFKFVCGGKPIFEIGRVPKKGEPHKMFTLCTRTVYLGADFYSTCARSFIFSDANVDCLALDISLDLPQILGRQRLFENPWKNSADFYYRQNNRLITSERFYNLVRLRMNKTDTILETLSSVEEGRKDAFVGTFELLAKYSNYSEQYVAVNRSSGSPSFVFNKLVMLSDKRAYDIQQIDYRDRFSVISTIGNVYKGEEGDGVRDISLSSNLEKALSDLDSIVGMSNKLKFVCTINFLSDQERQVFLANIPIKLRNYYLVVGPEKCKKLEYRIIEVKEVYEISLSRGRDDISERVYSRFKEGECYLARDIKWFFSRLYREFDIKAVAKATDLDRYFDIKKTSVRVKEEDGKSKVEGAFEIIKRKDKI